VTIAVHSFVEEYWLNSMETIERLDQRLIRIYDDRPRWRPLTRAWYRP
jgi:hypothetical protein